MSRPLVSLVAAALIVGCAQDIPVRAQALVRADAAGASAVGVSAPGGTGSAASPSATAATYLPLPAAAAYPGPCPPPPRPPSPPGPPRPPARPKVAETAVPKPVVVAARDPQLAAVTGKGTWAVYFSGRPIDVPALLRRAKAAGSDSIWIRTGGSRQGRYYGDDVLKQVLLPAHRAGLKVIAWDFPFLSDPATDAYRAKRVLAYNLRGHRVDGFSPDIETRGEGVFPTRRRIAFYLSVVRRAAGNRPVVATVPQPTRKTLASYPYRTIAAGSDALAPMVYWSCREPGAAVDGAMDALAQFGLPVHVIGQAYDMRSEGGRPGLPTGAETWRFVDVAHRRGAIGVSLYQVATVGLAQRKAIKAYPWWAAR